MSNSPTPPIRRLRNLSWWLLFISAAAGILAAVAGYVSGWPFAGASWSVETSPQLVRLAWILASLTSLGCALLSLFLAGLLFARRRQDRMAFFISVYLIFYAFLMAGPFEALIYSWGGDERIYIYVQTPLMSVATVILMVTFPSGRPVPRRSGWLIGLSTVVTGISLLRPLDDWTTFASPIMRGLLFTLTLIILAAMGTQVYRYRVISSPVERKQTRWVIGGLFLWVIYLALTTGPWLAQQNLPADQPTPLWVLLMSSFWWLSLTILPLSLTLAIFRSRLFDIDLIIRRTLIYAGVTGILVAVYYTTVITVQRLFELVSGRQSPLGIVLSTLFIAALFNPVRGWVQAGIDRRFFRQKYDAARTLNTFARTARDEVELENLQAALLGTIREALQPEQITLWLPDGD